MRKYPKDADANQFLAIYGLLMYLRQTYSGRVPTWTLHLEVAANRTAYSEDVLQRIVCLERV